MIVRPWRRPRSPAPAEHGVAGRPAPQSSGLEPGAAVQQVQATALSGDFAKGIRPLGQVTEREAQSGLAWALIGYGLRVSGEPPEAAKLTERVSSARPLRALFTASAGKVARPPQRNREVI